ncbi:hypothetical protein NIT7321_01845 [Phaeobacter italicus]|uniref:Uncharacterized protein n=1 Tax=Phaeobacter italicus TaxID=481446 RepID=A0A0H5D1H0_9RHOB|nr:hypothetical protein NIT7321_01845 [Phaeobacter italicus]
MARLLGVPGAKPAKDRDRDYLSIAVLTDRHPSVRRGRNTPGLLVSLLS